MREAQTRSSRSPSYLQAEEHIRAARAAGADAVHPGYGFLAENGDFAEAVEPAGLTWIGPPPNALRAGGTSSRQSGSRARREFRSLPDGDPEEVGFPLLVKAAAGGGGRGMRVVRCRRSSTTPRRPRSARRRRAFGDGTLYLERYLERPRHVEVQLLADAHGTVVALGERDCSVQRRHQKILEEAPAPGSGPTCDRRMCDAAVAFGRAIGYRERGHGRVHARGGEFFFLELNGRIQVEHPVTEPVTGLDLVEQQIRIADGRAPATTRCEARPATRSRRASMPRIRRTFLPQAGHDRRGCQAVTRPGESASTPASRRATRSGSPTTR